MRARCYDNVVCLAKVPWSTLVLLPSSESFQLLSEVDFVVKKRCGDGCVIEVPSGTVVRVKEGRKVAYYLLDGRGAIKLKGRRAKIIGVNAWGYHYVREDTGERVVTVIYYNGRFHRL